MDGVRQSADFQIDQPADILFPLFSPEGEKLWIPGWDYENVIGTDDLRENYVFITKNHDHAACKTIWIVKKYKPGEYLVEFYKVEPGEKVGVIAVKCSPLSEARSNVSVTYEYIAISEKGNNFISSFTSQVYEDFIGEWQQLLEAYFKQES